MSASTPLRAPAAPPPHEEADDDLTDEELRALAREGLEALDRGDSVDGPTFMEELRQECLRDIAAARPTS